MPPKDIELSPGEKLAALKALDQFRSWDSWADRRRCLACGKIITGLQIRVIGPAPFHLECPTAGCLAIPMDWSLLIPIGDVEESGSNGQSPVITEKLFARA
jgi:hypothetical protein